MKYVLAIIVCVGVFVAYVLIGAAVFGWERGGGVIPMLILFAAVGAIWRKITKSKTSESTSDTGWVESTRKPHFESDSTVTTCETDITESDHERNVEKAPEMQTVFQVETAPDESEEAKKGVVAEQIGQVKVACREEEICDAVANCHTKGTGDEQVKLCMLTVLVIILIALIAVRFSNTPAATRAGKRVRSFSEIVSSVPQRDLSTPSSRLVGHWVMDFGGSELYCQPINKQIGTGTYVLVNSNENTPVQFKILSEDSTGTELVIREFIPSGDYAKILGPRFSTVTKYQVAKDGKSMCMEISIGQNHELVLFSYVDSKTAP